MRCLINRAKRDRTPIDPHFKPRSSRHLQGRIMMRQKRIPQTQMGRTPPEATS